jgi:hypothetical protein
MSKSRRGGYHGGGTVIRANASLYRRALHEWSDLNQTNNSVARTYLDAFLFGDG